MLKFIKNIFIKKELPEEKVSLDEIDSWLDKKTKPIFDDLNIKINEIIEKISNEKKEASENLKTLENAQLQNPKIPERVKIIMQGNREGFIKKVSLFFNNIGLQHGDYDKFNYNEFNYDELIEKCRNIENDINLLGQSTARNYHILKEFFAREAEKIAASIKNMDAYSKELEHSIISSKISNINQIKSNIAELKNKIKLKESYSSQLENNNKILQSYKNKKTGIEKNINEIKSSHDYKNYEKLMEEKEKAEIKIKETENILFRDFSVLEKALKKYAKIAFEDENLILEYLENPAATLSKDDDFKIVKVLGNLKSSIEVDKLELEEKKKGKAIEKISELDGVYLTKIKDDFIDAKKMMDELAIKIESNNSRKALDSLNEELKNIKGNIEKSNNQVFMFNKELERIDIGKLKEELQKDINNLANAKIILIL